MLKTRLTELLGIERPIVLAPSMSAAAMPRPSKMPPAATTGMGDTAYDPRDERHRADGAAEAARLAALGYDHVDVALGRLDRLSLLTQDSNVLFAGSLGANLEGP